MELVLIANMAKRSVDNTSIDVPYLRPRKAAVGWLKKLIEDLPGAPPIDLAFMPSIPASDAGIPVNAC